MKLSFKMKVKLSLGVAFVFIIALVIHEDHAGVVLKKFKPRRAIMADLEEKPKVDSNFSTKPTAISKHQVKDKVRERKKTSINREIIGEIAIIRNSTDINNETVVKLENISRDVQLNSSVIYQNKNDTVLNHNISKTIPNLSKNLSVENSAEDFNRSNSNCSNPDLIVNKKDQNCSTTVSNISEISETKENSPQGLHQESNSVVDDLSSDKNPEIPVFDVKFSSDSIVNKSGVSQQENGHFQRSLNFEDVSDNHTLNMPRNESQINATLEPQLKNQSISNFTQQLSASDHLNLSSVKEKLVDKNFETVVISNVSNIDTTIGVNNPQLVDESVQIVREISQQGDPKPVSINNSVGSLDSENMLTNESFLNETEIGFESIVSAGLDFLAHSEVAKNAAVAMDIFNLSDSSLTDHIIDDPDSVIDLVLPSLPASDEQNPQNNKLFNETAAAAAALNETEDTENKQDLPLIHKNKMNDSHVNNNSIDELTTEIELDLLPTDKKKCPVPKICVFWFLARNTCTNDDQCLGSKICCRVRCSKQCIDV